jgi:hypothetical protein
VRALAILIALAAALALSALPGSKPGEPGGGGRPSTATEAVEPEGGSQPIGSGVERAERVVESGTAVATACEIVSRVAVERVVDEAAGRDVGPLEQRPNDSLDLSFCEYRETEGKDIFVRIGLDTAVRAVRRYYNMLTEAIQLPNIFNPDTEQRPQLVYDVGDDATYGGAGAYWIPLRLELISIENGHIVKVHFYVPGVGYRESKRAAAKLAKLAHAGYGRAEGTD